MQNNVLSYGIGMNKRNYDEVPGAAQKLMVQLLTDTRTYVTIFVQHLAWSLTSRGSLIEGKNE